jgi:hypothetical protein
MHGSNDGHSNDPTCELNVGPLSEFPLGELFRGESPSCLPSNGWWIEPFSTWASKLVSIWCISILTDIMVGSEVITYC